MKKFIIGLLLLICMVGCSMNMTAKDALKNYLDMYKDNDSKVVLQLDEMIAKEDLSETQKILYKDVMLREYKSLVYEIKNEEYEGDSARFLVNITVIDLFKASREATEYLNEHSSEFTLENGSFDRNKFNDYKLTKMKNADELTSYEITIKVNKDNGKWEVEQLSESDLQKLHGIYNYQE